jgi:hypothetical protein
MSGSISGGVSVGAGSFSLAAHAGFGLTPVFGFGASGGYAAAPFPAVLQFPGVPMLAGGFGASIGLSGGGVSVGLTAAAQAGFAGVSGNLSVNLGFASGSLNLGTAGIGGSLSLGASVDALGNPLGYSPFGLALHYSMPPLLTQDRPGGLFAGAKWGIFDSNSQPVATWDSVIKVDYRHDMKIADFPIEKGDFASYNKVQIPYDIRISFAVGSGGSPAKRSDLLLKLEQAVASLDFYSVITPEAVYTKANLVHLEYSRESKRGVNLLVVEVWVQEVRPAAGNAFTKTEGIQNPQTAAADNPTNSGGVQADDAPFDVPTDTSASGVANDPNSLFLPAAGSDIGASQDMPSLGSAGEPPGPPPNMPSTSASALPQNATPTPAPDPQFSTPDPTAMY